MGSVIFLVVAFGAMYALLIVPQQRKVRRHQELVATLEPGDEVLTASGLYGTIVEFEGEHDEVMRLEIAPEVVVTMSRGAVTEVAVDDTPGDAGGVPDAPPSGDDE